MRLWTKHTVENQRGQIGYPAGGTSGRGFDIRWIAVHAGGVAIRISNMIGVKKCVTKIKYIVMRYESTMAEIVT